MKNLRVTYFSNVGLKNLSLDIPQYVFIEPYGKVVVRYHFTNDGDPYALANIRKQVADPRLLKVKVLTTLERKISTPKDFENSSEDPNELFYLPFNPDNRIIYVDVLYESLTARRLQVKISTPVTINESLLSKGEDEFLKIVDVQIRHEGVYFTYVFRRSGVLKKYVGLASYLDLAKIYKEREFSSEENKDKSFLRTGITEAIKEQGYEIDYERSSIYKTQKAREIEITDEELSKIILSKASRLEILNLLKTYDPVKSNHKLRLEAEKFLQSCDRVCDLPETILADIIDTRGT